MVALWSPTEPSTAGSAPRNVRWQPKTEGATHSEKVATSAVLRFLRFQSPWAYGRRLFVLLRRAPAERWANVRYRLMDVAETPCVRGELKVPARWNMRIVCSEECCSHIEKWDVEAFRSGSEIASSKVFPSV